MVRRLLDKQDMFIALAAVLSVVVYVVVSAVMYEVGFALDDAWIHQVYARNLAEHGEWSFLAGQSSAAATSPLYAVLLAAGRWLHLPMFVWTFGLGALTLAMCGWFGARLAERLFPSIKRIGLWTGLAMVLTWHLVWAAVSGMETSLFCALALAVMWLGWREIDAAAQPMAASRRAMHGGLLGLVGAALTTTRPEGAGLLALIGLAALVAWPRERSEWGDFAAWAVGVAAGWLVGMVPYALLNLDIAGSVLPDTASAKQAEYEPLLSLSLMERYARLVLPILAGAQIMLLPGLVAGLRSAAIRLRSSRTALMLFVPLAWTLLDLTAYALRLPANYQHGRYVIPALPPIVLYGVGGTLLIVRGGSQSIAGRVLTRSLAVSAAALYVVFWGVGAQAYGRDVRIIQSEMVATAHWVEANIPADVVLAAHDIGALGYFAPHPLVDLAGLVTPDVVPIIHDHEALMALMCARGAQYLMALPDQVPADLDDPHLGNAPVYITNAPYALAMGYGNMAVYRLEWEDECGVSAP